jgi:hypothetical protein
MVLNALEFDMPSGRHQAPRVRAFSGSASTSKARLAPEVIADLQRRGHDIRPLEPFTWAVGGGRESAPTQPPAHSRAAPIPAATVRRSPTERSRGVSSDREPLRLHARRPRREVGCGSADST